MSTASATDTRARKPTGLLVSVVLLVLCAAAALFFGVSWAVAANDESVGFAAQRDDALQSGQLAIINFNTLDYRDVQKGLDRWAQSSTGPLHEEVVKGRDANAAKIAEAKSSTSAKVLDAAMTELDDRAGKARMIAVVEVVVTQEGQPQPAKKQSRYQAELTREGTQWKLSGLGPVAVG